MLSEIRIKLMRDGAKLPKRMTEGSVGCDIFASIEESVEIAPGETVLIPAGFALELPVGVGAFIFARSGLGIKHGITPANCVGVIDSDYRGEVKVGLRNYSDKVFVVAPEERIAQMVIMPVILPEWKLCDELSDTVRADGGFGSSGKK